MEVLTDKQTGVTYDDRMGSHYHLWNEIFTERPERYTASISRCKQYGLLERCTRLKSRLASDEEITTLHSKDLLKILKESAKMSKDEQEELSKKYDYLYFHEDIHQNARLALGCTLDLLDNIITGKLKNGMAIVRPPGHHAMHNEFNGYCYLNNVAIAAKRAIDTHGLKRILIVDWDVHHGQGIQYFYYDDPRVLYFSIHKYLHGEEWPYLRESDYDHIGEGAGIGHNINVPLNEIGCGDSVYLSIFFNILLPIAYEYNPELVLVSSGYDAALGCPEGEMEVTPACFAHFVNLLSPLAGGKLCLVLEGGYCIKTLAEGVALSLRALLGDPCPPVESTTEPCQSALESIYNVLKVLRPHWKCLQFQGDLKSLHNNVPPTLLQWPPKSGINFYTHNKPETFSLHQDCWNPQYEDKAHVLEKRVDDYISRLSINKASNKVCIAYSEMMLKHKDPHLGGYEECPERIQHIYETLKQRGLLDRCLQLMGRQATVEELELVHGSDYLRQVKKIIAMDEEALQQYQSSFKSIYLCNESYESASWGVGCTLSAVDSVLSGESQSGVAVVRPPGHHAEANLMMGFCIFNNIGIAAKYAQKKYGTKRILIVDWDIHHGNALQSRFYEDPSVLYISLHRFDNGSFYPFGGEGYFKSVGGTGAKGYNVNIAWNDGSKGDADYLAAFQHIVLPISYEFCPDLVLVAAGFDAESRDPLGGYQLSSAVFGHMTRMLKGLSTGKVVLVLEGGYGADALADSMSTCVSSLLGDRLPCLSSHVPSPSGVEAIRNTLMTQKVYWKSLQYNVDLPTTEHLIEIQERRKNQDTNAQNNDHACS